MKSQLKKFKTPNHEPFNTRQDKGYYMTTKHQTARYRYINGARYINYADLIMSDEEIERVVAEAKLKYKSVRRIKHPDGFTQLFVIAK